MTDQEQLCKAERLLLRWRLVNFHSDDINDEALEQEFWKTVNELDRETRDFLTRDKANDRPRDDRA